MATRCLKVCNIDVTTNLDKRVLEKQYEKVMPIVSETNVHRDDTSGQILSIFGHLFPSNGAYQPLAVRTRYYGLNHGTIFNVFGKVNGGHFVVEDVTQKSKCEYAIQATNTDNILSNLACLSGYTIGTFVTLITTMVYLDRP